MLLSIVCALASEADTLVVEREGQSLGQSATVQLPDHALIDADNDGALVIDEDDLVFDFAGELRGALEGVEPDRYTGVGLVVRGDNVVIRNLRVSGYRVGIYAIGADRLVLEDCDVSDNYRQALGSTPAREDAADWLQPHDNGSGQWQERYGAGILLLSTDDAIVRRCRARDGQNGLILDRSDRASVYDNDFSFLSGWGIAMWRADECLIMRNALDFCVRGYSHGVYNRGQDSAGLLMFEQCSRNNVVENSITHGGDGIFCFAGREALGELDATDVAGRGCNGNIFFGNDLSYSAAHGLECTFSFDNAVFGNRFVGNAICGIWGGYSARTRIVDNDFERNGGAGYGLERGGVNIEHGRDNTIRGNRFRDNACGVHLWWDPDEHLAQLPWALANGVASSGNTIVGNSFVGDELAIHLRACQSTGLLGNEFTNVGREVAAEDSPVEERQPASRLDLELDPADTVGETRPIGARAELAGREHIVMTRWGPYDWARPLLLRRGPAPTSNAHRWELLGGGQLEEADFEGRVAIERSPDGALLVRPADKAWVAPYTLRAKVEGNWLEVGDVLVDTAWTIWSFPYETDPRADIDAWHREADANKTEWHRAELELTFRMGGPSQLPEAGEVLRARALPSDRFGTIATCRLRFPKGRWRIETASDDGVRVWAGDELVIDEWTQHAPTTHAAVLELERDRAVHLRVEHFDLDGYATLSLRIAAAD